MKRKVVLVKIDKLKSHEAVNPRRLVNLKRQIKSDGFLRNPVVVDKKTLVVLDGHHRMVALKRMGCQKIAVYLVDYENNDVRVYLRRKKLRIKLLKEIVIKRAIEGRNLPFKTTRHLLSYRPREIRMKIKKLL